ncbi:Sucrose-phosphate synthase family protein [Perilla frutescens var. hirtella]|uniref:sucrose-phosphate synthase n=1 Tax=Perilla frutescens var. hirtella TaxID=608512 RepID=A0AAD4PCC7_PERFH|nr:Sucrose-phosphate synthase family protein [Perilla frutescens var. hirtella]
MGENEWVNGYLEAILDIGSARNGKRDAESSDRSSKKKTSSTRKKVDEEEMLMLLKLEKIEMEKHKEDRLQFTPTRYFVEEVINGFDEADLHRTWVKMIATRNSRHRNNRLENMCWRIWHLSRRKKQIAWDAARKLVHRRFEREKAAKDLSDLSEGESHREKGEYSSNLTDDITRISSNTQLWSDDKSRQLYIVLISLHGLVRGENMELGRDSDTGGQVKYVVELARALANMEGVHRVDLLTRQITSPEVDHTYGEPIEMLSCPSDGFGSCGAYIVRIPCGPSDRYIAKESLWPHIPEFVDGALTHVVHMARALGEEVNAGKLAWPYVIHGHYADAGEVAARLSAVLNVPMVLTGHSLGRNKLEQLLQQGRLTREDINTTYKIMRRIEAEELGLDSAEMVVTSTKQEIEEQWGMDFSSVAEQLSLDSEGDLKSMIDTHRIHKRPIPSIWSEIMRFFSNPHKPMILALSRPDPKKNITTLLKAFGECQALRELANLTLILGNRDDIEEMSNSSSSVLTTVLKLVDKYDLYGHVAYPKHHKQPDVPEIYRLAAKTKGVFINPALVEPFGLTLIEAAAYGLPIVATKNGGPVDILKVLNNGLLVDPHDQKAISDALLKLVADKNLWQDCRRNGLKNIHKFSWPEHCRNYLSHIEHCRIYHPTNHLSVMPIPEEPLSESLRGVEDLSLKFSIDVDVKANGEPDPAASSQQKIIDVLLKKATSVRKSVNIYCPGRRQRLYVIAVDSYNSNGCPAEELPLIIKNVMQVSGSKSSEIGFVLSTGLSLQETKEMLGSSSHVKLEDFDALVCSSGSEMCYPWRDLAVDEDYESHVEYRWPGENVRSIVTRLANDVQLSRCSSRCYSYSIKSGAKAQKIDDLRQRLRMRGLRCNLVYTHAASRLNVIPLFASRAQALRYLSVRWSIELRKVILFTGERGDSDYEDLLGGVHKTVILRDSVASCSEDDFKKDETIISQDNTKVAVAGGFEVHDISKALDSFSESNVIHDI